MDNQEKQSGIWHYLSPILTLTVFGASLWLLHHEFQSMELHEVADSFRAIPGKIIALSIFLTAANYVVLIGYDWLGVRMLNHPLSNRQIATAALLSYAFSNSLGFLLGGTPVRMRLYSSWGLSLSEVVKLIFYIGVTFWIGLFLIAGLVFVFSPFAVPARLGLPVLTSQPMGYLFLAASAAFFGLCAFRREPLRLWGAIIQLPPLKIAVLQASVSGLDFVLASAAFYVLLPSDLEVGFFPFVGIFLLAVVASVVTHVPGGLGVLELVLVSMLPQTTHGLVASMLAFRIIYYVLPLFLAASAIAFGSLKQHRSKLEKVASIGSKWVGMLGPRVMTGAVFVAGFILLVSGALPAGRGRMEVVRPFLPLPLIEFSHFSGSIVGALLLILARALQRRIDAAWSLTIGLLVAGAVVSLAKGFDYEESIVLTLLALAMIPCRKHFYRRGRLLSPSRDLGWIAAVVMSFGLIVWLLFFAYRHLEYSNELWWKFAYHGDAPRSLRALVGAMVVVMVVSLLHLLRPKRNPPPLASAEELEEASKIVAMTKSTNANLAFLGDKRFLFSNDRKAFVMFGCAGNCWVSMGDPVGDPASGDEVAWNFREACDAQGVWPVFYQVDESTLGRYIEMGLHLIKLGEEARVPLGEFSLEGGSRRSLRKSCKKMSEQGMQLQIVSQQDVSSYLPKLKEISDAWLQEKSVGEKGFSLGFYDEGYLLRFDMALITQDGEPIAFANIWKGAEHKELSIDLMRYMPTAPSGVMEFLFVQLMLWGKAEGYQYFNLGMSPLSGLSSHRLGPLWNRFSNLLFQHGEHFYNFQGLRSYKDKFDPEWTPKYMASPGGMALPAIIANVSSLVAGGFIKLLIR